MDATGSFGQNLGDRFRLRTPYLVSRALRKTAIAVTQVKWDEPDTSMTVALPREDAVIASVSLYDFFDRELWIGGRAVQPSQPLPAGAVTFLDLRETAAARYKSAIHSVQFYIPQMALETVVGETGAAWRGDLDFMPGVATDDSVIRHMVQALLPALENPEQASRLFVDHATLAVAAHIAHAYGGAHLLPRRGGLAPWQQRRAQELIDANLDGEIDLASIARACGLSSAHFARAFRVSVGHSPHQWLLARRVDRAKDLLRRSSLSLTEIALASGFSDQSHMTRIFSRSVGISPGAWRRRQRD